MVDVKCPKCGKNFIPAPYHAYKEGEKLFCSWTCYNHRNDKKKKRYHYKIVQQLTLDGEVIQEIVGTAGAAAIVDGYQSSIGQACKNKTVYKGYLWRYKE